MNNRAVLTDNIEAGVIIGPFTYIGKNVIIGKNCKIGKSVVIGSNSDYPIYIKNNVTIGDSCVIESPIKKYTIIESEVIISPQSCISPDSMLYKGAFLYSGVKVAGNFSGVGEFSILGINSILLEGRNFMPCSILESNSVYDSLDAVSCVVWAGTPAIPIQVNELGLLKIIDKAERSLRKMEAESFLTWWRSRN